MMTGIIIDYRRILNLITYSIMICQVIVKGAVYMKFNFYIFVKERSVQI